MAEFVEVARVSELSNPDKRVIEMEDRVVVLVCVDGAYYCIDDVCTHDGGPLGEGRLEGVHLRCPRHGAKFDVRDGRAVTMPATEDTVVHEVKVEGERILVRLRDD